MKTPSYSRIIGAEDLDEVRPFELSAIASGRTPHGARPATTAPQAENWSQHPAFQLGRQIGQREGFEQGAESARRQAEAMRERERAQAAQSLAERAAGIGEALAREFEELERTVADELVELAIELARQTLRQALLVDRSAIVAVVNEAVGALLDERASFVVHLNPADIDAVGQALGTVLETRGARLIPDRDVAAGGCRLISSGAEVDATVGTRWRRVLESIGHQPLAGDPICND